MHVFCDLKSAPPPPGDDRGWGGGRDRFLVAFGDQQQQHFCAHVRARFRAQLEACCQVCFRERFGHDFGLLCNGFQAIFGYTEVRHEILFMDEGCLVSVPHSSCHTFCPQQR
jgi:hypothetical protein